MHIHLGWNDIESVSHGPTLPKCCDACNQTTYYHLLCKKIWLTLYFIRVIPYETHWLLACPDCGANFEVPEQAETATRELNETTSLFLDQKLSQDDYHQKVRAYQNTLLSSQIRFPDTEKDCPACGKKYRLSDYRTDIPKIYCRCGSELPRETPSRLHDFPTEVPLVPTSQTSSHTFNHATMYKPTVSVQE
jgi:hypothetical protein